MRREPCERLSELTIRLEEAKMKDPDFRRREVKNSSASRTGPMNGEPSLVAAFRMRVRQQGRSYLEYK